MCEPPPNMSKQNLLTNSMKAACCHKAQYYNSIPLPAGLWRAWGPLLAYRLSKTNTKRAKIFYFLNYEISDYLPAQPVTSLECVGLLNESYSDS